MKERKGGLDFSVQHRGILTQSATIEISINTNQKMLFGVN